MREIGVIILGMFLVPKLMAYVPDFDPLMVIVGIFILLAVAQQLGFQMSEAQQEGRMPGGAGRTTGRRQEREEAPKRSSPAELLKDAERCLQQNNYSRAQELGRQITDADPENARGWEVLASALKWDGKRDEAEAVVKKALELYEVNSKELKALAKELSKKEDPGAMVKLNEKKGEEFFGQRQYDLAIECYAKALDALNDAGTDSDEAKKQRLGLLRRRAECAQQLQDWSTCRRDATALLEANPSDESALLQRAVSNEALEKFKDALEDARKLLAKDPKSKIANRIVNNCQQALRG